LLFFLVVKRKVFIVRDLEREMTDESRNYRIGLPRDIVSEGYEIPASGTSTAFSPGHAVSSYVLRCVRGNRIVGKAILAGLKSSFGDLAQFAEEIPESRRESDKILESLARDREKKKTRGQQGGLF
jgi:hypothetical protein